MLEEGNKIGSGQHTSAVSPFSVTNLSGRTFDTRSGGPISLTWPEGPPVPNSLLDVGGSVA